MNYMVPLGIMLTLVGATIAIAAMVTGAPTPIWVLLLFTFPGILLTAAGAIVGDE